MSDEMENRRKRLSSFGGNINLYRTENTDPMPSILVTVDNYAGLIESYPDVEDDLFRLVREGNRFGIWFMITCLSPTSLRYRLTQNFKQVLCLQLMDKMDYANVLGKTEGNEPMSRLGSGLVNRGEGMEFQAGFIFGSDVGNEYQQMAQMAAKASEEWTGPRAPRIRVLPEHVKLTDVCDVPEKISLRQVPLGIDKESMLPVYKDMTEEYIFPVLYSVMPEIPCIQVICEALAADGNRRVYMVDTGKKLTHRSMAGYTCVSQKDAAIRTIEELFSLCAERHNRLKDLEKEGREPETFPEVLAVFIAINELFDLLKDNEEITAKLDAVLKMGRTDMQMGVTVHSGAEVQSSVLMSRCKVGSKAIVKSSIIAPCCHIEEGEVNSSYVGPVTQMHHHSLLIAALWPDGCGNLGYGANVGSNHTGRMPDQEVMPGQGMFFGLGVNIKFPANYRESPFTLIATGLTTLPQRVKFPFSLIRPGDPQLVGVAPRLNEIVPGWNYARNAYALDRNLYKYSLRGKGVVPSAFYSIFNPDTVRYVCDAYQRLQVSAIRDIYTKEHIDGLGENFMRERIRQQAIKTYQEYLERYVLEQIITLVVTDPNLQTQPVKELRRMATNDINEVRAKSTSSRFTGDRSNFWVFEK